MLQDYRWFQNILKKTKPKKDPFPILIYACANRSPIVVHRETTLNAECCVLMILVYTESCSQTKTTPVIVTKTLTTMSFHVPLPVVPAEGPKQGEQSLIKKPI